MHAACMQIACVAMGLLVIQEHRRVPCLLPLSQALTQLAVQGSPMCSLVTLGTLLLLKLLGRQHVV